MARAFLAMTGHVIFALIRGVSGCGFGFAQPGAGVRALVR